VPLIRPRSRTLPLGLASVALALATTAAIAASPPVVGSSDTATADLPVARPPTTPCVVTLFSGLSFADFSSKSFDYAPPAACPGPWAKIVFEADFDVSAGRQYDRTGNLWIGGANVYFGTTMEPSRTVARTWHVERDLTDYGALFAAPQPGRADLGNLVDGTYTGVVHGSARLSFYPLAPHAPPPRVADLVLPLSAAANGGAVDLDTGASVLARRFTFPRNVEAAYLDVVAQSQAGDEFWMTCVPDELTGPLQSCGGTAFRETQVAIDGQPAGIAPVYPWLYTGAIDPYLWRPIPGVETLQFAPYRVDLTPFAGLLADGQPHEIALRVWNAHGHFSTTATLLVYQDHGARQTEGGVVLNTLAAAPAPVVEDGVTVGDDGSARGTVAVRSQRAFVIAGALRTSHGLVTTQLVQSVSFASVQTFDVAATRYVQSIAQSTTITSLTLTQGGGRHRETFMRESWPLDLYYGYLGADDGSAAQTTTVRQARERSELTTESGRWPRFVTESNVVAPTDTLLFDAAGALVGTRDQHGEQEVFRADGSGACADRVVRAVDGTVTAVEDGTACF
jgi:hypothetical protein